MVRRTRRRRRTKITKRISRRTRRTRVKEMAKRVNQTIPKWHQARWQNLAPASPKGIVSLVKHVPSCTILRQRSQIRRRKTSRLTQRRRPKPSQTRFQRTASMSPSLPPCQFLSSTGHTRVHPGKTMLVLLSPLITSLW